LTVERAIKSSKGLSASEIVARTKLPKPRVQQAVRELKAAKRIFQGGDRRFARYAGDARTAKQASVDARKSVAGPRKKK
jgi:DNA-binding transcriptional regulator GbsR (MarR family)